MAYLSQTENAVLTQRARESLKDQWGMAVGTVVVYYLVFFGISLVPFLGSIASIIIAGPMVLGLALFFLSIVRKNPPAKLEQIFQGFNNIEKTLPAYLLQMIFIFLWSLLLFIPGIIAAYSYSMMFYIIADNPEIGALEAITRSKQMMNGNKWKLFCLSLRFLGWAILCIFTFGIGFLWLLPYILTSYVHFYEDLLKGEQDEIPQVIQGL
ncbi:DUF975 family protein [candidate division KSB1 bacterium]|nr:DUF975 family protein [candidate division KSB1 bacterium]